ncbi:MAG: hypothetical protein ACUVS9_06190 [Thermaceae bacterium]
MRRLWVWILVVALVLVGAYGYWSYGTIARLEDRVARLEETVSAQSKALKALDGRLSDLEKKVAQQEAPPIALPEPPKPEGGGSTFWQFLGWLILLLLVLYGLLLLLRQGRGGKPEEKKASETASPSEASSETPRGQGEPSKKEGESSA